MKRLGCGCVVDADGRTVETGRFCDPDRAAREDMAAVRRIVAGRQGAAS